MSAFFVYIDLQQSAVPQPLAERLFFTLDHFGLDQKQLVVEDHIALGYQSMWVVPEEQGEQQPLYDADSESWLVFYGRIDNRLELVAKLSSEEHHGEFAQLSDARLFHQYLLKFGTTSLAAVIGPFVFVLVNQRTNEVLAARDAMGGRYLAYYKDETRLLISTYELTIAALPGVGYRLNEEKRLRLLCNVMENQPSTTLEGALPLLPGQQMQLRANSLNFHTFYLPNPRARIDLPDDAAYATEFRRLLDQAVQRRLRSIGDTASMLSGGMDSVPMTISAATLARNTKQSHSAYSWVFDSHPEADEREYSARVCDDMGITHHLVNCDQVWPQFDTDTSTNPVLPYISPYSEFNQALFAKAQSDGVRVLLSGIGGDMLYTGSENILFELLKQGRLRECWHEARHLFRGVISPWQVIKQYLLAPLPGIRRFVQQRRGRAYNRVDYLSDAAQSRLIYRPHWLQQRASSARRSDQYINVVDAFEGEDAHYGKYMEANYRLERRYPFRDRELVEFMLAVPAGQLYSRSIARPIVKNAYAAEFNEQLLARNSKTNFYPVISAGIERDDQYERWLDRSESWKKDLKAPFFTDQSRMKNGVDAVQWRCSYHEYWQSVCYNSTATELGLTDDK
ncbi:MAG: asparagine synthase-related protein [Pseudomonadota bacterium]